MLSTFILNLFVAMLMHAFEDAQEEIEKIKAGKMAPPDEDLHSSVSKSDASSAADLTQSSDAPTKRGLSLEASMLQLKVCCLLFVFKLTPAGCWRQSPVADS